MANKIVLKRSATPGKQPTTVQLDLGEIAINTYDGKIFIKKDNGSPSIVQIGGVNSVNGDTGTVVLDTGDISENGNLYFTDARARGALSAGEGISYNSTTGVIAASGSGVSGYSGYSGVAGAAGAAGANGESGFSGFSGYSGAAGAAGASGYSGAAGTGGGTTLPVGSIVYFRDTTNVLTFDGTTWLKTGYTAPKSTYPTSTVFSDVPTVVGLENTDLYREYITTIGYGNGTFVIVSYYDDIVAYSSDGLSWTFKSGAQVSDLYATGGFPSRYEWWDIAYGGGKFVTVGRGQNKAGYSTDNGQSWSIATLPATDNWTSIVYGDGKFVTVAQDSSSAAYSTDGINWTATTMPSNEFWTSVTYGNGKFVAVSINNSNAAAYSTDGINWTATTMPSLNDWNAVTYGDGKFVAVTSTSYDSDVAAYSTDGINWTSITLPRRGRWSTVAYGNGVFVVGNYYTTDPSFYSRDLINWGQLGPFFNSVTDITFGGGAFVAVEENGELAKNITFEERVGSPTAMSIYPTNAYIKIL